MGGQLCVLLQVNTTGRAASFGTVRALQCLRKIVDSGALAEEAALAGVVAVDQRKSLSLSLFTLSFCGMANR